MDEQQPKARRRRSRAEVAQLVAEFRESGLSRGEFCRRHGLSLSTLNRYCRRRRDTESEVHRAARWVAVEVASARPPAMSNAGSGLAVVLSSGRRIEIGRGFDADTLEQLVRLLEQA